MSIKFDHTHICLFQMLNSCDLLLIIDPLDYAMQFIKLQPKVWPNFGLIGLKPSKLIVNLLSPPVSKAQSQEIKLTECYKLKIPTEKNSSDLQVD